MESSGSESDDSDSDFDFDSGAEFDSDDSDFDADFERAWTADFERAWTTDADVIIAKKLYLGNIVAARSTELITALRITHILSVCFDEIPAQYAQSGIRHMRISIEDEDHDLLVHLPAACQFIHHALQSGGAVLVHSVQGLSRSAAVVAAYLMWSRRIGPTKALEAVRRAREQIWPNSGFQEQLVLFELCQYAPSPMSGVYQGWRYKRDHCQRHKLPLLAPSSPNRLEGDGWAWNNFQHGQPGVGPSQWM
ncbi:protein-tyrosine phosphatase-like protein [Roridomyces roridus]|uniref:protein-tyrosine-phosphatase n=1 Tax=Roridomyces roridus TaxID=1738132 RepID=A0AAD7FY12_9AGAR|nr:protein-tyrosine phosphatase-like protein [Roridomyces roridus]